MGASPQYLFVYGTLCQGEPNPVREAFDQGTVFIGEAHVAGCLYDFGAFPGVGPAVNESDRIHGELYEVTDPRLWAVLDDYEGCGPNDQPPYLFTREWTVARLANGDEVSTQVYTYAGEIVLGRRVRTHRWRTARRSRR